MCREGNFRGASGGRVIFFIFFRVIVGKEVGQRRKFIGEGVSGKSDF